MKGLGILFLALVSFAGYPSSAQSLTAELKPETLEGFNKYAAEVEEGLAKRIEGKIPFLRIEENKQQLHSVLKGEIVTTHLKSSKVKVENAIIHEWSGAVYLKDSTPEDVSRLLLDYDNHSRIYPEVLQSKLVNQHTGVTEGYLKIKKKTGPVTAVFNTTHEAHLSKSEEERYQIWSTSVQIKEIKNFGKKDEQELPEGKDSGYLWRLNSYWHLKKVEGGVLAELTVVTLSRDVPLSLFWIKPFLKSVPKDAIESTLSSTRDAIGLKGIGAGLRGR